MPPWSSLAALYKAAVYTLEQWCTCHRAAPGRSGCQTSRLARQTLPPYSPPPPPASDTLTITPPDRAHALVQVQICVSLMFYIHIYNIVFVLVCNQYNTFQININLDQCQSCVLLCVNRHVLGVMAILTCYRYTACTNSGPSAEVFQPGGMRLVMHHV